MKRACKYLHPGELLKFMKYLSVLLFILMVACNGISDSSSGKNYIPAVPSLESPLMTPEVLWSLGRTGNVVVSPGGDTVLFTVTFYNIDENRPYRDVFLVNVSGSEVMNLTNSPENEF